MKVLSGKRAYLDAMGIDVWSVRPAIPVPARARSSASPVPDLIKAIGAAPQPVRPPKPETAQVATSSPQPEPEVPRFRLALLHYGTFGICVSLSESESVPRRFCDDLARVMGADLEGLRYHELTWPMLSTSGIDQSVNAAREVVTQKLKTLPARVLVIGEDVAEYFGALREAQAEPRVVGPQSFLLIPSMVQTSASADVRRSLFVSLQVWRNSR